MRTASLELSKSQCERHRDKRQKKHERILTLAALIEMHERDANYDHEYLLGLRARYRAAVNQLNAMKI